MPQLTKLVGAPWDCKRVPMPTLQEVMNGADVLTVGDTDYKVLYVYRWNETRRYHHWGEVTEKEPGALKEGARRAGS